MAERMVGSPQATTALGAAARSGWVGGGAAVTLVDPALAARCSSARCARRRPRRALRRGAPGLRASLDDRRVERPQGGRERGACVRVVRASRATSATWTAWRGGPAARGRSVAQAVRGESGAGRPAAARRPRTSGAIRPETVEAVRKADLLRACDERARAAGAEVAQVRVGYGESRRRVEVYNSDGRAAADDRTRVRARRAGGRAPRRPRWRPAPTRAAATPAGS